jgi:hypothetical protein
MPGNIREFTNPIDGLRPDDKAEQSSVFRARHTEAEFAYAGQAIGKTISAVGGAYDKIKTQQDISQGLATSAQIQDNLTTAWDVTLKNADPNDHSVGDRFREEQLNPILDAWTTSFSTEEGRQWAENHAGALRQHFFEKTAADQSLMAGQAAVQNIHQFTTGMSNTVLQDPSSLNMALGTADMALDAILKADPNITPPQVAEARGELRQQMRQEIAKSAFIGTARTNPDAAMQDLQDGKYKELLDGTTSNQMFGFAESLKREKRADERAEFTMQKEQQKTDFEAKASALSASMFAADGSIIIPKGFHQQLQMLALHPGADASAIRSMGDAAARAVENANNRTFQSTDNATWRDLAGRIGAQDGSAGALSHAMVDKAYAAGKLSNNDFHFLHQAVETAKSDPAKTAAMTQLNQALERVKPLVDKSNLYSGKLDQTGVAMYDDLHYDTFQKFQRFQAQGMSAQDALKKLTDPRDPDGIQANLAPYQTNNKAGLAAIHARVAAGGGPTRVTPPSLTAARKPGESAADYLARIGK